MLYLESNGGVPMCMLRENTNPVYGCEGGRTKAGNIHTKAERDAI